MTQNTQKIQGKFYPLTPDYTQQLRQGKLTAAEWKLWSYLISFDPWGDKYQDLPDTLTILSECDIKKSTFYKAIAKLKKVGALPDWVKIQTKENIECAFDDVFGENLDKLPDIESACLPFNVNVTGEEV